MRTAIAAAIMVALLATGCGGGDDEDPPEVRPDDTSSTTAGDDGGGGGDPPVSIDGDVNNEGTAEVGGGGEITISAVDFAFDPTFVEGAAGREVVVEVSNDGQVAHTFTTDGGVDEVLDPGTSATVELQVPADAPLVFYCRFHRASGMQGAFAAGDGSEAATDTSAIVGGDPGY